MATGYVLLDDQIGGTVRRYSTPKHIISAQNPDQVPAAFDAIKHYHGQGYYLAGYCAYELGYVLEPALLPILPSDRNVPLLQFGVFENYGTQGFKPNGRNLSPSLQLQPAWTADDYSKQFEKVIEYIKAGDVYQINLTFPMVGRYEGRAEALYAAHRKQQAGRYGGVISLGGADIISLSPELFFKKAGPQMDMRPMKGTVRRQADPAQDQAAKEAMRADMKSRAENLMIVDLLRNDLSRIAKKGSVSVPELFALETYPTLHQMTSQVRAQLPDVVDFFDIFKGLFPCGSVTGAPKIRAMEIIRELEEVPRGAYCGSMGYIDPDGDACFNVAIRTLTLAGGNVTYNVGSGVVLDSTGQDEYDECLLKAKVITQAKPELIETMRWVPDAGILRWPCHEDRLKRSAKALGYEFTKAKIMSHLREIGAASPQRVRLTLSENGEVSVNHTDFAASISKWIVSLSKNALTPSVQETRYKVSARNFYDQERNRVKALTGCDEVLFFNANDELCEGSFTSIFMQIDGHLLTPDLKCGLLPGVLRETMLEDGQAVEAVLTQDDLNRAERIYVGNSLRGLIHVELTDKSRH